MSAKRNRKENKDEKGLGELKKNKMFKSRHNITLGTELWVHTRVCHSMK